MFPLSRLARSTHGVPLSSIFLVRRCWSSDGLMNRVADRMAMPERIEYTCSRKVGLITCLLHELLIQVLTSSSRWSSDGLMCNHHSPQPMGTRGNSRIVLLALDEKHRVCDDFIQARALDKGRGISCVSPPGDDQVVECC